MVTKLHGYKTEIKLEPISVGDVEKFTAKDKSRQVALGRVAVFQLYSVEKKIGVSLICLKFSAIMMNS